MGNERSCSDVLEGLGGAARSSSQRHKERGKKFTVLQKSRQKMRSGILSTRTTPPIREEEFFSIEDGEQFPLTSREKQERQELGTDKATTATPRFAGRTNQ